MFIAHLPSGYLLAKYLKKKTTTYLSWKAILIAGILGGIFPDLDLLYFYFIDARLNNHHSYMSHIPIYWFFIYFLVSAVLVASKHKKYLANWSVFMLGVFLHLILDTVAGGILWYYPLDMQYVTFSVVDAKYSWWVLNFVLHWTFALEMAIVFSAAAVYLNSRYGASGKVEVSLN